MEKHKKSNLFILMLSAILALFMPSVTISAEEVRDGKELFIYYSNDIRGAIEARGWGSNRMGGLSRKAFQIKQSKKNIPTVAVDGGAFFFNQLTLTAEPELTIAREKAAGMARASMEMDMDGMGVAPLDLAAGSDFLKRVARDNNLPLLSMNLFDRDTKETIFPR